MLKDRRRRPKSDLAMLAASVLSWSRKKKRGSRGEGGQRGWKNGHFQRLHGRKRGVRNGEGIGRRRQRQSQPWPDPCSPHRACHFPPPLVRTYGEERHRSIGSYCLLAESWTTVPFLSSQKRKYFSFLFPGLHFLQERKTKKSTKKTMRKKEATW